MYEPPRGLNTVCLYRGNTFNVVIGATLPFSIGLFAFSAVYFFLVIPLGVSVLVALPMAAILSR